MAMPGSLCTPLRSGQLVAQNCRRPAMTACSVRPGVAPVVESRTEASNIVAVPARDLGPTDAQRRKMELQAEVAALLEQENSWWCDTADAPANLLTANSPAEYKRLIVQAPANQLVVVDYLKPGCMGCRRLFPKLKQIAAQNPDALFLKVNVEQPEMRELAQGMQVSHLPWFHMFREGQLLASFSANVATVSTLRAELATHKACEDPRCDVY